MPKTLILDSSQLTTFLECAQKWYLTNVEHLTLSLDIREDMAAGTYGHKLLEIYYKNRLHFNKEYALQIATKFHLDDEFPLSPEKRELVHSRFIDYWTMYKDKDIALATKKVQKTFSQESSILYDRFVDEPLVEQGFSYELLNTKEYLFILEGRIDLIGLLGSELVWMDHKFQGRRHDLYKKSIQFRNYSLATNLNLGLINYVRLHKELSKDTFVRDPISFSSLDMRLWKEELIELYIDIAKQMSKDFLALNRGACAGRFGIPCEFTKICEEGNARTQKAIKETYYKIREEWKPW